MNYKFALVIYFTNKLLLFAALAGILFSIVMIIFQNEQWLLWFAFLLFNIVLLSAANIFSLIRKSKVPLPRDFE